MVKREAKKVRIKANLSFMDIREGDESTCPLDGTVQGWLNAGYVRLLKAVTGGEDPAGSGSAEPDDAGSIPDEG